MRTPDRAMNNVDQLVEGLNSSPGGERILAQLVAVGNPAVGALKNFLFRSNLIWLRLGVEADEHGEKESPQ